jgi:Tat protein secretion system quality control protein TatD with DNase activity
MFIDSHVHFDRFVKDGTFVEILEHAKEAQVHEMVAIGGSSEANALSLKLAQEHPGRIFGCAGYDRDEATKRRAPLEPQNIEYGMSSSEGHSDEGAIDLELLKEQVADPLCKAVGETGLDYYYTAETAAEQKSCLPSTVPWRWNSKNRWSCIHATPTKIPSPSCGIVPLHGKVTRDELVFYTASPVTPDLHGRCWIWG